MIRRLHPAFRGGAFLGLYWVPHPRERVRGRDCSYPCKPPPPPANMYLTLALENLKNMRIALISTLNPFTPESDQCQNSPAASQEIWHHTAWRTWLFIAYSDEKWLYYKFSLHHSYNRFLKGWENTLFELRSERVNSDLKFFQIFAKALLSTIVLTTIPIAASTSL